MSCRRAFDLDLADFVAGSARPEWAEFRAHYARCAECSAEVRAWTELHLLLQPPAAHPAEELLLRLVQRRAGRAPSLRFHGPRAEGRGLAGALLCRMAPAPGAAPRAGAIRQ